MECVDKLAALANIAADQVKLRKRQGRLMWEIKHGNLTAENVAKWRREVEAIKVEMMENTDRYKKVKEGL